MSRVCIKVKLGTAYTNGDGSPNGLYSDPTTYSGGVADPTAVVADQITVAADVAVLVADGATPTQAHVTTLNADWATMTADIAALNAGLTSQENIEISWDPALVTTESQLRAAFDSALQIANGGLLTGG